MPRELKWFCANCQHYATDHVPEDIEEQALKKRFSGKVTLDSRYFSECRKCDCMMFEKADVAPDDKDSVDALWKKYGRGIKTKDMEDFIELWVKAGKPEPSSDKEYMELFEKIRKWVTDGRPK